MTETNIRRDLEETCQRVVKDLEEIGKAEGEELSEKIEKFLEGVLEIQRIQSLVNGKWETQDYIFLVGYGGPNIWIDGSEKAVKGSWLPEKVEISFTQLALEGYKRIAEYLDEIYPSD